MNKIDKELVREAGKKFGAQVTGKAVLALALGEPDSIEEVLKGDKQALECARWLQEESGE